MTDHAGRRVRWTAVAPVVAVLVLAAAVLAAVHHAEVAVHLILLTAFVFLAAIP